MQSPTHSPVSRAPARVFSHVTCHAMRFSPNTMVRSHYTDGTTVDRAYTPSGVMVDVMRVHVIAPQVTA